MHGLHACLFKYNTVDAFCIYARHGADAAKRGGWRPCIKMVMEITLLIMEKSWKNHGIVFLNICGNPV